MYPEPIISKQSETERGLERAPVQNQLTRELISARKTLHKLTNKSYGLYLSSSLIFEHNYTRSTKINRHTNKSFSGLNADDMVMVTYFSVSAHCSIKTWNGVAFARSCLLGVEAHQVAALVLGRNRKAVLEKNKRRKRREKEGKKEGEREEERKSERKSTNSLRRIKGQKS